MLVLYGLYVASLGFSLTITLFLIIEIANYYKLETDLPKKAPTRVEDFDYSTKKHF